MCVQGFMKFRLWGFKILRKQSVTDGTDGRTDNVKTVYPTYNFVIAGGINREISPKEGDITCMGKVFQSTDQLSVMCNIR